MRRIAIIQEAPVRTRVEDNHFEAITPLRDKLLREAGIEPEQCRTFYVVQTPCPQGDAARFKWGSEEVVAGVEKLRADLLAWQPHFALILDWRGLGQRVFAGERRSIDDWRGSLFESAFLGADLPLKCLATYHPKRIQMDYGLSAVVRFDLKRALEESRTDRLDTPHDDIAVDLTRDELLARLREVREARLPVAIDIEGWPGAISCIGFATGANHAFVVPFIKVDNTSYWPDVEDEVVLWEAVAGVLEDECVPKWGWNNLYEQFVLPWTYGIVVRNFCHDGMVMWFELYCELEKSLGFVASILTKHPFYKFQRKTKDERVALLYNGRDCCRTYECIEKMLPRLMPRQREHYTLNIELLTPLAYMQLRGIKYDYEKAQARFKDIQKRIYALQDRINREAAPNRPELAAFFEAIKCNQADALIPLLAAAFCRARCTEKREVEETSWQPMRWNGKKWVKAGKRVTTPTLAEGIWIAGDEEPDKVWRGTWPKGIWFRTIRKTVTRTVPVEIKTLEDVQRFVKDSQRDACKKAILLCKVMRDRGATPAQRGELATLFNLSIKINASGRGRDELGDDGEVVAQGDEKDANWFLYEHCGFPKQFKKEGIRLTDKLDSGMSAVLTCWSKTKDRRALWFLAWRSLDTRRETLNASVDPDGRIRCGYNVCGTETVRFACYKSSTGSGYNLQTTSERDRDLLTSDTDCDIGSFDLRGADSFTVAAMAAAEGDNTMMDDLKAGLKIQTIVALIYKNGPSVNKLSRAELKELSKTIDEKHWLYKACKMVVYGSSYLMGPNTMMTQSLKGSYKKEGRPVYIAPKDCLDIQERAFFVRYWGIRKWHLTSGRALIETGSFTSCGGHVRRFFGKRKEMKNSQYVACHKTLGEWLAHAPQFNTTYSVKLALRKMWSDPENRREDGSLRVEPLHTVHDSLNPQWKIEDREFAKRKIIPEWFNNPIRIGHTELVIPSSSSYGPSWGETDFKL